MAQVLTKVPKMSSRRVFVVGVGMTKVNCGVSVYVRRKAGGGWTSICMGLLIQGADLLLFSHDLSWQFWDYLCVLHRSIFGNLCML